MNLISLSSLNCPASAALSFYCLLLLGMHQPLLQCHHLHLKARSSMCPRTLLWRLQGEFSCALTCLGWVVFISVSEPFTVPLELWYIFSGLFRVEEITYARCENPPAYLKKKTILHVMPSPKRQCVFLVYARVNNIEEGTLNVYARLNNSTTAKSSAFRTLVCVCCQNPTFASLRGVKEGYWNCVVK